MTEVLNCGGGHCTRLRDCLLCVGVPLTTYINEGEEEADVKEGRAIGGAQLGFPILVGVPFLFQEGERGKEEEREKERGGRRPLPSPIQTCHGGRATTPCGPSLLSTKAQYFPGGFR